MKSDDELKRLRRFIVVSWSLLLAVLMGVVFWASLEIKNLKDQVILSADRQPEIIRGIDGKDGAQGLPGLTVVGTPGLQGMPGQNGVNGTDGLDGQSVTATEIADAVSSYLQTNPVVGATGLQGVHGDPGRTLQIRVNSDCQLQSKYEDADDWNVIAQLPVPCNPTTEQ